MLFWLIFIFLVLILLALDLGVLNRKAHIPSSREALLWTSGWVTLSLLFSLFIYWVYQHKWPIAGAETDTLSAGQATLHYITGYLVELSLSMDNVFVIALIFNYFNIPGKYQHRVLFWGILGALIFRGIMIGIGAALVKEFDWINYVFGAILLYSAWKMLRSGDETIEPEKNPIIRLLSKYLPVIKHMAGQQFVVRRLGVWAFTPLFVALIFIEISDVMFAIDSIPAIFAITTDPFLVFTSNIFAILGLRSMYFVLASMINRFPYLSPALSIILLFVALKLILHKVIHLPEWVSLLVIVSLLAGGIGLSLWKEKKEEAEGEQQH